MLHIEPSTSPRANAHVKADVLHHIHVTVIGEADAQVLDFQKWRHVVVGYATVISYIRRLLSISDYRLIY